MHIAEGYEVSSSDVAADGDTLSAVFSVPKDHVEIMNVSREDLSWKNLC